MAEIALDRVGELLRNVLELLWNRPEGMQAKEIIAILPEMTELSEFERGYSPLTHAPRYERIIRLATIPLVRAGWLVKNNRGHWCLTEAGRQACRGFRGANEFYTEALRRFDGVRGGFPSVALAIQHAEESAWQQIQEHLRSARASELLRLVADLLTALGYHVGWVAPAEKTRGQIDMVAYVDPIGANGRRALVQVQHSSEALSLDGVNSFRASLRPNDYGLLVSSGGFTPDVKAQVGSAALETTTLWDLEALVDAWIRHYRQLSPEAQRRLPLKAIHFLDGAGGR